jgi:hypothetical protein
VLRRANEGCYTAYGEHHERYVKVRADPLA